ncbi:MAG: hypothetical protein ACM3ZE_03725 [Myxococcales bacterium]
MLSALRCGVTVIAYALRVSCPCLGHSDVTLSPRILMMCADYKSPCLFSHTARADWGVALLVGESDGKRRYLFENGEERTLASGFYQMMRFVEKPSADQCSAYAKLRGIIEARNPQVGVRPNVLGVIDQVAKFHAAFASGFSDPLWVKDVRGDGAPKRLPNHRQPILESVKEQLSQPVLDTLIQDQRFGQVWEQTATLVGQSGLVSAAKLKFKPAAPEQQRALAVSIRDLLYGDTKYERRFDHFVHVFLAAFVAYPHWELATAPSALIHPNDHVCVDVTLFRKQMKLSNVHRVVGGQPSSAGYNILLGVARLISNTLVEQGEEPRDLFDVRDFIAFTLKPEKAAPKAASVRGKPPAREPRGAGGRSTTKSSERSTDVCA